ncbi:GntR family transcriptional regulator [Actinomadura chokoriensis]|uniref:GntR family transcriptional regulator n=1 Tax=Actinomadura chokoriensis TaxID=454156 RepID=UPI0031FA4092
MANALHKEIADELREKIRSGEFAAGRRLPTEPELERLFGASRNTIRIAVTTLVHEGLIQIQPGRGMFVPEGPIPFFVILSREEGGDGTGSSLDSYSSGVRAAGRKPSIRDFETRIEYPDREVAGWLEIDEDAQVVVRGSKRFIDDTPYSLQKSYYAMDLVRGTELEGKEKIPRGTIRALAEMGYEQSGYRDELVARMPTPEEKRFFKIGPGIPVVVVHRVAYTSASVPIRLTVTTYAADRNRPSYDIGEVPERPMATGQISIVG